MSSAGKWVVVVVGVELGVNYSSNYLKILIVKLINAFFGVIFSSLMKF